MRQIERPYDTRNRVALNVGYSLTTQKIAWKVCIRRETVIISPLSKASSVNVSDTMSPSSASRSAVSGCLTHISPLNANESSSVVCYSSSVGIPKVLLWFVTVYRVFELRQRLGSDLSSLRYSPSCTPVSIKSLPFCLTARPHQMDESRTWGVSPQMWCCSNSFSGLWYFISLVDLLWNVYVNVTIRFYVKNILLVRLFKDTNRTTLTELQQLSHIFRI